MKLWLGMKLFAVFSSSGFRNGAIFDSATPSGRVLIIDKKSWTACREDRPSVVDGK